jgi:hypothetical protein
MGKKLIVAVAAVVLLPGVMFEVQLNPRFALPRTVEKPDAAREALYERCVAERTDEATRQALDAADNPDVQSLMIRMRQKEAIADCRREFPQRLVEVGEPLELNIVDLRWRF